MLYYCISDNNEHHLVVEAEHKWHARNKASEFVNGQYDINLSPSDFGHVVPLTESVIIK